MVGLALIGASCEGGNVDDTNPGDSPQLSSSAIAVGTTIAYEAETLTRTSSAIGSKVTADAAASGGKYVEFNGTAAAGAWIEFTLANIAAGSYDLKLLYKSNNNRGIVQASLDGVNQGATCNEYASTVAYKVACSLGSKTLTAGNHTIRFTVTGKGASSSGYQMVVDQVSMTYQGTSCGASPAPQFAQNPQSYASPCNSTDWVTFTVAPTSGTTVSSVQWHVQYPGSTEFIPGPNDRLFTGQGTLSLRVAPQSTEYVWATITDSCGRQASSSHALLTVPDSSTCGCAASPAPQFAQNPQSYASPCNSTDWVTFTVAPTSGTTVSSVQWHVQYPGSTEFIPGPNDRLYTGQGTLSLRVAPQSTEYVWATITDSCGRQASSTHALLTVPDSSTCECAASPAPQFAQNPQSYASPCNSTAWVSFTAAPSSGTTVSSVQWHVQYLGLMDFVPDSNDRYHTGQTTFNLQVAPQDSQYVWCTITDNCGRQVSSTHALLTVPDPSSCP